MVCMTGPIGSQLHHAPCQSTSGVSGVTSGTVIRHQGMPSGVCASGEAVWCGVWPVLCSTPTVGTLALRHHHTTTMVSLHHHYHKGGGEPVTLICRCRRSQYFDVSARHSRPRQRRVTSLSLASGHPRGIGPVSLCPRCTWTGITVIIW